MSIVSGNIRRMQIFAGVPLGEGSNDSGVVDTVIFGDLCGYFFRNVGDKASNIT